jgi:hypothetical protein
VLSAVQASESPSIGRFAKLCGQSVAFHIATNCQEMLVILYRKRLVSALVKVPVTNSIVMGVIPLRVSQREPELFTKGKEILETIA